MLYRIRYRAGSRDEAHFEVEANSPTEAVVKFSHTQPAGSGQRSHVVSVCPDCEEQDEQPQPTW